MSYADACTNIFCDKNNGNPRNGMCLWHGNGCWAELEICAACEKVIELDETKDGICNTCLSASD